MKPTLYFRWHKSYVDKQKCYSGTYIGYSFIPEKNEYILQQWWEDDNGEGEWKRKAAAS